jgi:hypothetical protein
LPLTLSLHRHHTPIWHNLAQTIRVTSSLAKHVPNGRVGRCVPQLLAARVCAFRPEAKRRLQHDFTPIADRYGSSPEARILAPVDRPYTFYELTNSICSSCHIKVEAKIVTEGDNVFMLKRCPVHGAERVLISTDFAFYKQQRNFLKPGQLPLKFNTAFKHGCPYDCGLCPDHEQHSCISLIEITDQCNLTCPVCYASSSPERTTYSRLDTHRHSSL